MKIAKFRPPMVYAVVYAVALAAALAGCSLSSPDEGTGSTGDKQVVLATHDSWAVPKRVLAQFTKETGFTVKVEPSGDAGALTNKLVLTKGSPIADAVFGIDNTFASRAVNEGVLTSYRSPALPASAQKFELPGAKAAAQLTPVDYGDVCVNVDDAWFAGHKIPAPRTLDDLVKPAYKNLFVAPGATTSSPGLAFLLATIAEYGDRGWQRYWTDLMANGAKLTSGWSDAYEVDFSGGGGHGDRPIVVSYDSSPPFTIPKGTTRPTTSALLDTCFRQVEYAGVLAGGNNPAGAKAFIDFMLGESFQKALPDNMYVFPVDDKVALPELWAAWAKTPAEPLSVPPDAIAANRDTWLRAWGDITSR